MGQESMLYMEAKIETTEVIEGRQCIFILHTLFPESSFHLPVLPVNATKKRFWFFIGILEAIEEPLVDHKIDDPSARTVIERGASRAAAGFFGGRNSK